MLHPDEVECPCQELRLQSIAHEKMAQKLARIHRLLVAWEEEDRNDYDTLRQVQRIVNSHDVDQPAPGPQRGDGW
jgi:hypothetical protein